MAEIDSLADLSEARSIAGPFRVPVDRVFTITGFGTVVTGTLVTGTLRVGDPVRVLPERIDTRVRGLQVHGEKREEVYAGTRVAVNLAGVELPDLQRGSVLLPPGTCRRRPRWTRPSGSSTARPSHSKTGSGCVSTSGPPK